MPLKSISREHSHSSSSFSTRGITDSLWLEGRGGRKGLVSSKKVQLWIISIFVDSNLI